LDAPGLDRDRAKMLDALVAGFQLDASLVERQLLLGHLGGSIGQNLFQSPDVGLDVVRLDGQRVDGLGERMVPLHPRDLRASGLVGVVQALFIAVRASILEAIVCGGEQMLGVDGGMNDVVDVGVVRVAGAMAARRVYLVHSTSHGCLSCSTAERGAPSEASFGTSNTSHTRMPRRHVRLDPRAEASTRRTLPGSRAAPTPAASLAWPPPSLIHHEPEDEQDGPEDHRRQDQRIRDDPRAHTLAKRRHGYSFRPCLIGRVSLYAIFSLNTRSMSMWCLPQKWRTRMSSSAISLGTPHGLYG